MFVPSLSAHTQPGGQATGTGQTRAPNALVKRKIVKPGACWNNGDVQLCTSANSRDSASISPETGASDSATTVRTQTGWIGTVDGVDANDTTAFGGSSSGTVTGSGGTVTLSGNCNLTAVNAAGGPSMHVYKPDGSVIHVPPGTTQTITT